nr:3-oxoacyl-[acyl-carrier-protein] synthase III C-terminal domain-containing protein [Micromonospora sp. DSM 115978]
MTSVREVSSHLPHTRVPVDGYLRRYGLTEARIEVHRRYFGYEEIRHDPDSGLADQLLAAAGGLRGLAGNRHRIRYVLHARTIPICAPHPVNPLRTVLAALSLDHATGFSVTQHACASGLLAVHLAGRLLAADGEPDTLALVFCGEKAFTTSARVIGDTGVIGEGTAAVLVSAAGERDRVLSYAARTHGEFGTAPYSLDESSVHFQNAYPELLAEVMLAAVEHAGLGVDDVTLVLPHNVNRMSWLQVMRRLGLPPDRLFLENLPRTGHCFNADAFVNYRTAVGQERLRPGDRYLMTGVGQSTTFSTSGFGATFSAMLLEH